MQVIMQQNIMMQNAPWFPLAKSVVFRGVFEQGRVAEKRAETRHGSKTPVFG
jgi:hypothetical protein